MITKKYVAKDMNEAFVKIRQELGRDAVIISQRKVRKPGLMGLFSPKQVEVVACADRSFREKPQPQSRLQGGDDSMELLKKMITERQPEASNVNRNQPPRGQVDLQGELAEMKKMLSDVVHITRDNQGAKTGLEKFLVESDVEESVAREMALKVQLQSGSQEGDDKEVLKELVAGMCSTSQVKMSGPVVLVGPTGVGKTTTIAKLAGRLALVEKKKVGLITIDTYRIGAIEQLKTYAEIMNIPFKVVMTLKDMEEAVKSMEGCDAVLVDTTGRSSRNAMQISELRAFIDKVNTENIHLVISCTTKAKDIMNIVNGYKVLGFNHVIITKLDETSTYGSILNILKASAKPVSFITTGQSVPDDIKRVDREELASLVMGEDSIC